MLRLVLLLACTFGLLPASAIAGAWPREKGTGFVSTVTYLSWPQNYLLWESYAPETRYDTLYLEYGLTARWTVGLDLGRSVSGAEKVVAFARRPLARPDAWLQIAAEIGAGQIDGDTVLRPGLSLGYGWDGGWVNADLLAEHFSDRSETDVKLDLTYGRTLGRHKLMMQVQAGKQAGDEAFVRLVPSIVTPIWRKVSLEIGATYGVTGDESMGLKLGIWTEF
ncbi:hypothetical protein FIU97_01170 [Roseivivax sp. THAF40]|uniref:hypothetical protein n=1 Tax=unclassified Roseivivax TaxID=2639302 RepID=UPI001268EB17|nr:MULTISPECIES: hypothetical protein [unclassified Roseivivax]QFS81443.1 hypothetical protein FIV09_01260 [Roseivivax sp. THAF197b]QFT45172.1 hypothetical protein FIU97_01170 [Roseivivax sp. THAF40]